MYPFWKSRIFSGLIYAFLIVLILLMLQEMKPVLSSLFIFLKVVLSPFIVAMIISYILNPIVNVLNRRKVPRTVAVLLIYGVFLASLTVIVMNVYPVFMRQLKEINEYLPELNMKAQNLFDDIYANKSVPEAIRSGLHQSLNKLESGISKWVSAFLDDIGAKLNLVLVAFIIPFVAFYMMKDFKLIEKTILALVPRVYRKGTVRLVLNIDKALGNYIRGQLLVCLLVGGLAYAGYLIIGLPYSLLLASLVGLFNIIPYLGPFFGLAPALVVASTISFKMMIFVIIVNLTVQILEGNVIGPQIVGKTLHLHPLMIIFALLVGGEIGGILGLILAVPILAVLKVITQYFIAYYIHRKSIH